jgi:hypothetical protein
VGKGQLKERRGLEPRTNFFPFKKSPETEYGLDLGADYIREYTVCSSYSASWLTSLAIKMLSMLIQQHCGGLEAVSEVQQRTSSKP